MMCVYTSHVRPTYCNPDSQSFAPTGTQVVVLYRYRLIPSIITRRSPQSYYGQRLVSCLSLSTI